MGLIRIIALFSASLIVIGLPFIFAGFPDGSDEITHIRFADAYHNSIQNGHLLPQWMMDNSGYGGVGVRFYPPVSSLSTVAWELVTGNWYDAFCANILMWMFIGCVGTYCFTTSPRLLL